MKNPLRRKQLEDRLKTLLQKAETTTFNDPQLKAMVREIRNLYRENQEDFLIMLGLSSPTPQSKRPILPFSKIPRLLQLLDTLETCRNDIEFPLEKTEIAKSNPLLSTSLPLPSSTDSHFLSDYSPSPLIQPSREDRKKEIEKILNELQEATTLFDNLKKDEEAIRSRKGKYGISMERLKAERLLRELPGKITRLVYQKKVLEEE